MKYLIILLSLFLLVSCHYNKIEEKFSYGEKVKVTKGLFRGCIGTIYDAVLSDKGSYFYSLNNINCNNKDEEKLMAKYNLREDALEVVK